MFNSPLNYTRFLTVRAHVITDRALIFHHILRLAVIAVHASLLTIASDPLRRLLQLLTMASVLSKLKIAVTL